jgi:hypothetical protein
MEARKLVIRETNTLTTSSQKLLTLYSPKNCLAKGNKIKQVSDCFESKAPSIGKMQRSQGKSFTNAYMMAWLVYLNEVLGLNKPMSEEQIRLCAQMILDDYYMLNVADLTLMFRRVLKGDYGEFYERLSIDKIQKIFKAYFEERCGEAQTQTLRTHNDLKSDDTFAFSDNPRRR